MAVKNIDDLRKIKEARLKALPTMGGKGVTVCGGPGCLAKGSVKIKESLQLHVAERMAGEPVIYQSGCHGLCAQGPVVKTHPDDILYLAFNESDVTTLVDEHLIKNVPIEKYLYKDVKAKTVIAKQQDIPFFNLQVARVLKERGITDPDNIDDYIAMDGYMALAKTLSTLAPRNVLDEIKDSGLRGRGGGGFPTGLKWELCSVAKGSTKYLVCNAGPISRSIVEVSPHLIIEGMIIASYATGAQTGYVFVREPDNKALIKRLEEAIDAAAKYGFIGTGIMGSNHSFNLELSFGAGTFICGEETALMRSIEGRRGYPTPKPPYPVQKGLWGCPTIVDNAETFANVPMIILNGAPWFREVGTASSPGTKVFTLTGEVNNNGLIEVPMGMTFRAIVDDIGGAMKRKKKFKALHIGGPTGGFIPESMLDTPAAFDEIVSAGAIVGSGNLIVMDDGSCMVNTAMYAMEFAAGESCGKCVPCRIGTKVMYEKLKDITEGRATVDDIDLLEETALEVKRTSLCGLGQTAPLAILSTIKYFRNEYVDHIEKKWCQAGRCRELSTFYIDKSVCTGCTSCARKCPQKAITGQKKKPHFIDQSLCVKCRTCFETCAFGSVKIGARGMNLAEEVQ